MPLTRVFLDWNRPALPAAVDYLISRYAAGDQLDMSRVVLVFPGRRASRRMLELLVQKAGSRWPALIPPQMVTFQQFPELLYHPAKKLADDLTQLLVWKQAISSISPRELRAALPSLPGEDSISSWMALCETLRRQHDELAADGMEFDEVFEKLFRSGNKTEGERWKALRRIQSEYLMRMDELELWDRQAARLIAVQQNECSTDSDIILIGTVDMNRIIQQMLDQVADHVTALIHAPASEADAFDGYGCLIPDAWVGRCLNLPDEMTRIVNSAAEQGQAAVQEIAALNGRFRADDITIGVGSDKLVPSILQCLSNSSISGRWPVGMEIQSTRPYRLLEAVARHLSSARDGQPADFSSLSHLVRHPDVYSWVEQEIGKSSRRSRSRHWLNVLDQYLAEHLQAAPGALLGDLSLRTIVGTVCTAVEKLLLQLLPHQLRPVAAAANRTGSVNPGKSVSESRRQRQLMLDDQSDNQTFSLQSRLDKRQPLVMWAEGLLRVLTAVYGNRPLNEDDVVDRGIRTCFETLQSAVESLRRIPQKVMPELSATQALQLMLKQIADGHVNPDPDEQAIDLMGWLELPLDDAPVLILTGFNEGFIPESITSDVFLPNSFRTQLGLTDNHRRYARDAYALSAIMASRRRLTLISGRADEQGNPLAPSRLWFAADPATLPHRVRRFYAADGDSHNKTSVITESPVVDPIGSPPSSANLPVTGQGHSEGLTSEGATIQAATSEGSPVHSGKISLASRTSGFSLPAPAGFSRHPTEIPVSAFRDYLYCPYRYFLSRELRLRFVEDESRELTASAFGSLVHEVLCRFAESAVRDSTTPEAIEVFLLTELKKLATHRFGRTRSATVSVQLKMLENRLEGFARWQAASASEGWRIRYSETDLRYDEFSDIHDRRISLKGRVDRIDQHQVTGEWRVLDYKTSEAAEKPDVTHRKKGEWLDLQLPLYRLLIRSLGIDGVVQLGYVHLPGDLSKIGCTIADWEQGDLESAELRAREIAADIIDLRIDRVARGDEMRAAEFARICQDSVIDRSIPWLEDGPDDARRSTHRTAGIRTD